MTNLIGWVSAILLGLSGIPFAWSTYKQGSTDMSLWGIILILSGMAGMLAFELLTARSLPQVVDFTVTVICWSTVLRYKLLPRSMR